MELFEFKRYLGDSDPSSSKTEACADLNNYLEEVKLRKRKREVQSIPDEKLGSVENNPVENAIGTGIDFKLKKKKKGDRNISSEGALTSYLERVKSRKQRREDRLKRQSEVSCDQEDVAENCDTTRVAIAVVDSVADDSLIKKPKKEKRNRKNKDESEDKPISGVNTGMEITDEVKDVKITDEVKDVKLDSESSAQKPRKKKKKKKKKTPENEDTEVVSGDADKTEVKKEQPVVSFEVLGAHSFKNKVKVKRVLPRWLSEPTVISAELTSGKDIMSIGKLHYKLVQNLKKMGINELFPVQMAVIPNQIKSYDKIHYLWPRDLCVSAPTGSGKTLAYVVPVLQAHYYMPKHDFYALVVVPVQELALQVAEVFRDVAAGTEIRIGCITGGSDMGLEAKNLIYKREDGSYTNLFHILIATPGRLMEHFFLTPGFNAKNVKFIVIDEADRVVEQKSLNWLHLIEKQCDMSFSGNLPPVTFHNLKSNVKGPQKLLFSATLSQDPEKLLKLNLFQPKLITSIVKKEIESTDLCHFYGKFTTPVSLKENYVVCNIDKKPLLVHKWLVDGWRRVLIFTKSCVEANRLYKLLKFMNPDTEISELTSLMVLSRRQSVVHDFGNGDISILVCSNRMARGMDIKNVNYVVIYDPPKFAKGYIHEAGRTGRAGLPGTTVTIVTPKQASQFLGLLRKAGKTDLERFEYDQSELETYMPAYSEALNYLTSFVNTKKNSTVNISVKEKRTKTICNLKKRKRRPVMV